MVIKMFTAKQEAFARKLKQLRSVSQLSQAKLAKDLNISRSCLANYESGKRFPSPDIIDIISNYFNVTTDYLLASHSPAIFERSYSSTMVKVLRDVSSSGTLDISALSPLSKLALFEFYNFLNEQDNLPPKQKNA